MNDCCGCDNEREEEVEGKEPGEGSIVYRKATPNSLDQGVPHIGNSR